MALLLQASIHRFIKAVRENMLSRHFSWFRFPLCNMKIGILTQPLHYNYGGIIQNWALQQVLLRMGHMPEMIFLTMCGQPGRKMVAMRTLSFAKNLIRKHLLNRRDRYIHSPLDPRYNPATCYFYADGAFVKRIHKTKVLGCDADLAKLSRRRRYEAFIVGSDQVWREDYSPRILAYFLDFLPDDDGRRRIAYAASFGKERDYISPEKMPECRRLMSRFHAVSVREAEGVDIVRRDFGRRQVDKVLDPTLLLSAADYSQLISPGNRRRSPYIASYILDRDDDKAAVLAQVAAAKNLPVNEIDIEVRPEGMPTVSQWLANFADADFVVTDSFHGCVFSIIFGKPFIAIGNAERGLGRFLSLLGELDLMDRLITTMHDFRDRRDALMSSPDYAAVNGRLALLRQSSLKFLTDALA